MVKHGAGGAGGAGPMGEGGGANTGSHRVFCLGIPLEEKMQRLEEAEGGKF